MLDFAKNNLNNIVIFIRFCSFSYKFIIFGLIISDKIFNYFFCFSQLYIIFDEKS